MLRDLHTLTFCRQLHQSGGCENFWDGSDTVQDSEVMCGNKSIKQYLGHVACQLFKAER
jgi:hypothetical protein